MRENNLTEMQEAFVVQFTSALGARGNASESARRAGYSEKTAAEQGRQLLQKPHVQAAITEANRRQISGAMASKATALLEEIVDDDKAPIRVRLDAAKTILDRAGYVPPKASEPEDDEHKPLAELTIEELDAIIRRREEELRQARERDALEVAA